MLVMNRPTRIKVFAALLVLTTTIFILIEKDDFPRKRVVYNLTEITTHALNRSTYMKQTKRRFTIQKKNQSQIPRKPRIRKQKYVPLQPVEPSDWGEELPDYGVSKFIQKSEWWQAAGFLELDFRIRPRDYKCRNVMDRGNWYICMDGRFKVTSPCLVYSFGIGNDFSFDDDMAALGCEVHSFDPSMGLGEHIRNTSVNFHPIGLSNNMKLGFDPRKDIYVQKKQSWLMMDLESIMKHLGHKNKILDVLKIDIEGHEWAVLEDILQKGLTPRIKQLSLEYHLFPDWPKKSEYKKLLSVYRRLHDFGFKKFFTGIHPLNHLPTKFNIQADIAYVNTGFRG